jgi:FkbM family methyltransferase
MLPFRSRFLIKRILNPFYYKKLSGVVASPLSFFSILLLKALPGVSTRPVDLKLRDGSVIRIREFWALFLFDEIFIRNCYEPPELLDWNGSGTIVDIGANIGLFTLCAKQLWPRARVIAIEPHPANFQHLSELIEVNGLTNVDPLPIGVADKCGCFELYISGRNIAGHSMYKSAGATTSISVPTETLLDILVRTGSQASNLLIKIDCEGCEYAILSILTPEMATHISGIVFEPENALYDVAMLTDNLQRMGFRISRRGEIVVASKPASSKASGVQSLGMAE